MDTTSSPREGGLSSAEEEELLRSSGGESQGGPQGPTIDEVAWDSQRRAKRKEKRNQRRARRRGEERQAQKVGKQQQGGSTQPGQSNQAQSSHAGPASLVERGDIAQPGPSSRVPSEGTQVNADPGTAVSNATTRGPKARGAKRVVRREARQSFTLPKAPASVRGIEGPGSSRGHPGSRPSTTQGSKRGRPEKEHCPSSRGKGLERLKVAVRRLGGSDRGRHLLPGVAGSKCPMARKSRLLAEKSGSCPP